MAQSAHCAHRRRCSWYVARLSQVTLAAKPGSLAMPPHSGQGASQALEDAAYLAYLLRKQTGTPSSSDPGANQPDCASILATFQMDRQPRVNEIVDEANRRGGMKKDQSVVGYFMKKWMMRVVFLFMRESWGDGWFGYKVPGIDADEW